MHSAHFRNLDASHSASYGRFDVGLGGFFVLGREQDYARTGWVGMRLGEWWELVVVGI